MNQPTINAVSRTHVGLRRERNEDSTLCDYPAFLVADGMGGHGFGDKASQAAIECFTGLPHEAVSYDVVESLCRQASSAVAAIDGQGRQPGTTMTGAIVSIVNNLWGWLIVNIGDSRTYLFREGQLAQVTTDHSRVQELVDMGVISQDDAQQRTDKNVITRAFGASRAPETSVVDVFELAMRVGDRMLVCSDGLHGMVDHDTLQEILNLSDINECADALVQAALDAGGNDNIGLVLADVHSIGEVEWEDEDETTPMRNIEAHQ